MDKVAILMDGKWLDFAGDEVEALDMIEEFKGWDAEEGEQHDYSMVMKCRHCSEYYEIGAACGCSESIAEEEFDRELDAADAKHDQDRDDRLMGI